MVISGGPKKMGCTLNLVCSKSNLQKLSKLGTDIFQCNLRDVSKIQVNCFIQPIATLKIKTIVQKWNSVIDIILSAGQRCIAVSGQKVPLNNKIMI